MNINQRNDSRIITLLIFECDIERRAVKVACVCEIYSVG